MLRPRRAALSLVLAATVAVLTGCGSEPPARVDALLVELALTDYRIEPQRVEAPSGRLRLTVRNTGRVPHNLEIRGPGGRVRWRISTLLPGESGQGRVRLPPGEWTLYCAIGNHEELGQHGELRTR